MIYEIAIIGKVKWDFHSLNNEGTVGNVTEPRTLTLPDGKKTDGVSGEMLKHIHAYYLWQMIDKNKLCDACKKFEPSRADSARPKAQKPEGALKEAITRCVLCDLHGFLLQKPACSRESTLEFGWAIGIPEVIKETHIHARHTLETEKITSEVKGEEREEERARQMIYHRPTRTGEYGVISVFQPWRIGLNDSTMEYVVKDNERKERYKYALRAYEALFTRTEGAMTSTRLAHTESFNGVIVYTETNFPVPVISPLKDTYIEEITKISESLKKQKINVVMEKFDTISQFIEKLQKLENKDPWKRNG